MASSPTTTLDAQSALLAQRRMTVVQATQIARMVAAKPGETGELGQSLSTLSRHAGTVNVRLSAELSRHRTALEAGESPEALRESLTKPRHDLTAQHDAAGALVGSAMVIDDPDNARGIEAVRKSAEKLQHQTHELMVGLTRYDQELALAAPELSRPSPQLAPGQYPHTNSIDEYPQWPTVGRVPLDADGRPVLEPIEGQPVRVSELARQLDIAHTPPQPGISGP